MKHQDRTQSILGGVEILIGVLRIVVIMDQFKNNLKMKKQKEEGKFMDSNLPKKNKKFPSRYNIGEKITLNFFKSTKITDCEISGVRFTEGKVRYDILIPISDSNSTLIKDVDSGCVEDNLSDVHFYKLPKSDLR